MRFKRFVLQVCLSGGLLLQVRAAEPQTRPPVPPPRTPSVFPLSWPLPSRSPVEAFRELLTMPRAERAQFLASKTPEARKSIMAKLREYESLSPDKRELRLQVTELRWFLLPLMRLPSTNRADQVAKISEPQRSLLLTRLAEWDALPAEVRQDLLENQATLQYFTEIDAGTAQPISDARRKKLEEGIAHWQALPENRRRETVLLFNKFFDLNPDERKRALDTVSEAERRQIEKTLAKFGSLPEQQREQCIRSFQKFASLPLNEREAFLKNAERWKLLSPEERQSWRELVSTLSSQPPLPSGASRPSPAEIRERMRAKFKMPPLPHSLTNRSAAPQLSLSRQEVQRITNAPTNKPATSEIPAKQ